MTLHFNTLNEAADFGFVASAYSVLRRKHPTVPARLAYQYIRDGGDGGAATFEQFVCGTVRGHSWSYSGTNYGGGDDRWCGEGRCLCSYCGADGDA
jgi:hypothetical protein